MKSASDYFDRLANDPDFAREMSERQHRLGQLYRCRANELCESHPKGDLPETGRIIPVSQPESPDLHKCKSRSRNTHRSDQANCVRANERRVCASRKRGLSEADKQRITQRNIWLGLQG